MRAILCAPLLGAALLASASPRTVMPFNTGWQFQKSAATALADLDAQPIRWQSVRLPHTWNAEDALPGKGMYQGIGWYAKTFDAPASWGGRRVFVRFGAASLKAAVFLNGKPLGEHRGGFAAFCFELTSGLKLGQPNVMAVRVDNRRGEISPLAGDFTVFGGLYRPATIIVTDPVAITPLDYASPGVYLKQVSADREHAELEVTTKVSNGADSPRPVHLVISILDARRREVVSGFGNWRVAAGATQPLTQKIELKTPHLWDGVRDPYLYTARIRVYDGPKVVDEIEQPLGLRTYHVDPERGFVLNGRVMQIHGVCMHQEGGPQGWAVSDRDEERDMALLRDMGVDGVRLAHYQHSDHFHSLCDQTGVLVWSELALVNNLRGDASFLTNLRQQLIELIRQNYNHPSIVIWSMYNEIGSNNKDKPGPIVKELGELAHAEDPTRLTSGAASGDTMYNLPDVMRALDLVSLNIYSGWYGGKPEDMGRQIDQMNQRYGSKGVSMSEYGGGASVHQHEQGMTKGPNPNGHWHPEEWEATLHEIVYAQIKARPTVWGAFPWVMFDFASAGRREGDTDGINDKGLVTRDRRVKKDAYFFYQASWTDKPMVYITSRRDTLRKTPVTAIKVYSNCPSVKISVNGVPAGTASPAGEHVFVVKRVVLTPGENLVEAEGEAKGRIVHDECRWTYSPG